MPRTLEDPSPASDFWRHASIPVTISALCVTCLSLSEIRDINCFCHGNAGNKVLALLIHLFTYTPASLIMLGWQVIYVFPTAVLSFGYLVYFASVYNTVAHAGKGAVCDLDTRHLFLSNATQGMHSMKFITEISCDTYMQTNGLPHVSAVFIVQILFLVAQILISIYEAKFVYSLHVKNTDITREYR